MLKGNSVAVRSLRIRSTRFSCPMRIVSISKPASGTSFDSMPVSVPIKTARWPRSRRTRATAIAGKTCPPVPPPVITKLSRMLADAEQHAHEQKRAEQRGASVADERQRNAFVRKQAQHDAHIDQCLRDHADRHAERQIPTEGVGSTKIGAHASPQDHHER